MFKDNVTERSFRLLTIASAGILGPLCMFSVQSLVVLLTLLALSGGSALFFRGEFLAPFKKSPFYFGLALIGFSFLSSFWSLDPKASLKGSMKFLALFTMAFMTFESAKRIINHRDISRSFVALTIGFAFSALLLIFENYSNLMLLNLLKGPEVVKHQYNQVVVLMAIFSMPLVAYWFKKKKIEVSFGILFLIQASIFIMESEAAKVAFLVALFVSCISVYFKCLFKYFLMGALTIGFLTAPFLEKKFLAPEIVKVYAGSALYKDSFYHRLHIWNFVGKKVFEKPLLGWGMNSSRHQTFSNEKITVEIPVKEKKCVFENLKCQMTEVEKEKRLEKIELLPLHPHNVALQLWLELGFVGILLGVAFFVSFILRTAPGSGSSPVDRFSYYGCLMVSLIIYLVSYGMWQSWWLALLGIASTYVMLSLKKERLPLKSSGAFY